MFHIKYIIVVVQSIFLCAYTSSYLLSLTPSKQLLFPNIHEN